MLCPNLTAASFLAIYLEAEMPKGLEYDDGWGDIIHLTANGDLQPYQTINHIVWYV